LLATGGAAGAAALVGFRPWDPSAAAAATGQGDTPAYLLRSSYLTPSTPVFGTSSLGQTATLKLEAMYDLGTDKALAGSEDAFALAFSSDTPLESGTRSFSHPDLGVFELFVSPIEGHGLNEVVVNRSVGAPKHAPRPPSQRPPAGETKPPPTPRPAHAAHVRRLSAHRQARDVVVEIGLNPDTHVKTALVWLSHGGMVVAAGSVHHVKAQRVAVRLPMHKRPRGGRYELTVGTKDRAGHMEYKRVKIALQ
jgi:hypothetical protein